MAGVVIAAAAGGAPRSHGTVPLRPGYTPPPFRRRRNRTGANGNIANHVLRRNSVVGRALVEALVRPRHVQLGTVQFACSL